MEASAPGSSPLASFSTRTPITTITPARSRTPPITRQIVGKLRFGCAVSVMPGKSHTPGYRSRMAKATARWSGHKVKFDIEFVTAWDGKHDKESVEKAIDLACNRYCPIHATLSHGTKIEHRHKDT